MVENDGEALDPFDVLVGKNLQDIRKARGYSQEYVADRLTARGIPFRQQTLAKVEQGRRPLRFKEADQIAAVLEISTNLLLDEPAVLDKSALLMNCTRAAAVAWDRFLDAAREFLDQQANVSWAYEVVTESAEGPQVSPTLLSEAMSITTIDLKRQVEAVEMKMAAEAASSAADLHALSDAETDDGDDGEGASS